MTDKRVLKTGDCILKKIIIKKTCILNGIDWYILKVGLLKYKSERKTNEYTCRFKFQNILYL